LCPATDEHKLVEIAIWFAIAIAIVVGSRLCCFSARCDERSLVVVISSLWQSPNKKREKVQILGLYPFKILLKKRYVKKVVYDKIM
jgi:hypothetical protein